MSPDTTAANNKDSGKGRRCLLVDAARIHRSARDRAFSKQLANGLVAAGWEVVQVVDEDDPLEKCPSISIYKLLPPLPVEGLRVFSVPDRLTPEAMLQRKKKKTLVGKLVKRYPWLRKISPIHESIPPVESFAQLTGSIPCPGLSGLVAELGPQDMVFYPAGELVQLEAIFELLPNLSLASPLPATLHFRFADRNVLPPLRGGGNTASLGARLRAGSPFQKVVLHAGTAEVAREMQADLGLQVNGPGRDVCELGLPRDIASYVTTSRPGLEISKLGPMVLLVSALWGRTGSTSIFDAQARYFLRRGFLVLRVFVEQYPLHGESRPERINRFLGENFEQVKPHLSFIVERRDEPEHLQHLLARPSFKDASPVHRIMMLFADPLIEDPYGLDWAGKRAALAVTNHLPNLLCAQQLTSAPMVFETHDLFRELLDKHGIPEYVPVDNDEPEQRESEENAAWKSVAGCVNLSIGDHEQVCRQQEHSALIKPYFPFRKTTTRPWAEVIAANKLGERFKDHDQFDLLILADWHGGNITGVRWFIEQVIPADKRLQNVSLLLVGRVADGLPAELLQHPQVHVTGFVDQLDDFIARAKVFIIPDQGGSGLAIKGLVALAYALPFVSTKGGMRSIDFGDTGLVPCDDKLEFAADIVQLLASADVRAQRSEIARQLYELNFSSQVYTRLWDEFLQGLVPGVMDMADKGDPGANTNFGESSE